MAQIRPVFSLLSIAAVLIVAVRVADARTERAAGNSEITAKSSFALAELTASDGAAGNALGTAVAASGNTVVVGENCGQIGGNTNCNPEHQVWCTCTKCPKADQAI